MREPGGAAADLLFPGASTLLFLGLPMRIWPFLLLLSACGPQAPEVLGSLTGALCTQDEVCLASGGCKTGKTDCATGHAVCAALVDQPDGTSCGAGRICSAGACIGCSQGQACTTNDGCKLGHIDCATGSPSCTSLSNQPDGTVCSGGRTCVAGACTGCGAGQACFEAAGCRKGTIECGTGAPVCSALADEPDGKACAQGACSSGACLAQAPADGGSGLGDAGESPVDGAGKVHSNCQTGLVPAALLGMLLVVLPVRRRRG